MTNSDKIDLVEDYLVALNVQCLIHALLPSMNN